MVSGGIKAGEQSPAFCAHVCKGTRILFSMLGNERQIFPIGQEIGGPWKNGPPSHFQEKKDAEQVASDASRQGTGG